MDERRYWDLLENRVDCELAGLDDERFRGFWCDGFAPDTFVADDRGTRIRGRVWFGRTGQEPWDFVLLAGRERRVREDIDWEALLPARDVTGWLSLDPGTRFMKVNPAAASPDNVVAD